jgi:drug/metabolite transporter (DMT)-like permease
MAGISLNELLAGVFIGIFLFGGYAFQTVGLQYTGAANAGFITGLSVVLVPLYVTFSSRRLPQASLAIGVLCSVTGLALLSLNEALRLNYGDILIFFCAACFAGHILMVGKYTARHSSIRLTVIQIGTVSVISLLTGLSVETFPGTITGPLWTALILTAIPATSLAFLIQNKVQKYTSATSTALIFTMEPVFAGLGAFLLAGETLSYRQLAGCILILAGMLATELKGNPSIPKKAASQ